MTALVAPVAASTSPRARRSNEQHEVDSRFAVLAGTLAHELKNPLASAITNLAVAKEFCDASDPVHGFLARTEDELERIRRILRACIGLACGERAQRREVEVAGLLAACVQDAACELSCDVEGEAWIDDTLARRAVENVVENAQRMVRAGEATKVELRAERRGDQLVITVRDDGPGVPEAMRDEIFDALVSGSSAPGGSGTGLGLAIVRRICAAHEGDVVLLPADARGGAAFELRFGRAFRGVGA